MRKILIIVLLIIISISTVSDRTFYKKKPESTIILQEEKNKIPKTLTEKNEEVYVFKDREVYQNRILSDCKLIHEKNFLKLSDRIFHLMITECDRRGLPYSIFFSVVDRESGFRFIKNQSGSNAMGYMQMMPRTFRGCSKKANLSGGHTPENNIKAGAFHLSDLYNDWSKSYSNDTTAWKWALAEYAVGEGGLQVKDSTGKVIGYKIPEVCYKGIDKVLRNYLN